VPLPKQVFRSTADRVMTGDLVAEAGERHAGTPLLVPAMRGGRRVLVETLDDLRERASAQLGALPSDLRFPADARPPRAYPSATRSAWRRSPDDQGSPSALAEPLHLLQAASPARLERRVVLRPRRNNGCHASFALPWRIEVRKDGRFLRGRVRRRFARGTFRVSRMFEGCETGLAH
jgi:hypothetical protein